MKVPFRGERVKEAKRVNAGKRERFQPFLDFLKGKKIFLALSGGGLALVCHIALLRFLEEHDIQIDRIYGASAGAVIGGFYSAGLDAAQLREAALCLKNPDDLFGRGSRHIILRALKSAIFPTFSKNGFEGSAIYDGNKLEYFLEKTCVELLGKVPRLGELERRFSAIAFNIGTGKSLDVGISMKKVFSKEATPEISLKDAITASISIPGIFPPKRIGNYYYIDGGIAEHLPIFTAFEDWLKEKRVFDRNLVIIAVDLGYLGETLREKSNIKPYDMVMYAFNVRGKELTQYSLLRAHRPKKGSTVVLIKPRCYNIRLTDFEKIPDSIERSYQNILSQLEGSNYLKETEEDIRKAKSMIGINE